MAVMRHGLVPINDVDFNNFLSILVQKMKKYKDTLNLTDEDLAVIPAWQKEWQEVYLPTVNRDNCTLA
ncbi:hypothetical protein Barb6_00195 [Bacteroidales bacterium Barb6]|nr:hypothetical protein Barb6_00195 [Bacteroidales bacterium Barb6]